MHIAKIVKIVSVTIFLTVLINLLLIFVVTI